MFHLKTLLLAVTLLVLPPGASADVNQQLLDYIEAMATGGEIHTDGHCGFRYQFEIRQYYDQLDAEHKAMVAKITARPERTFIYESPGGHFIFHYDTTGNHAIPRDDISGNGVPDYIDSAAVIFDHVWDVEIGQLGFRPPLGTDGQPLQQYDIYFTELPSTLYGQTWLESPIESVPDTWTSYIEINTSLDSPALYTQGLDGLRVTAAHEFNHAIQLGYRVWEDSYGGINDLFFMEMTSTWLEEYVYDDINDYLQYLPALFRQIASTAFTNSYGNFPYGNSLYLHMTELLFGPDLVVDVWDQILREPAFDALDHVLRGRGSSWPLTQNVYARWLYFTGDRSIPGVFFPEAADYPMLTIGSEDRFVLNPDLEFEFEIRARSMKHLELENASDVRYRARLDGPSPDGYYSHLSKANTDGEPVGINLSQAFYPGDSDTMIVAVSNPLDSVLTLTYEVRQDTILVTGAGPNPVIVTSEGETAFFYNVPAGATIQIFTMNGRFVNALKTGQRNESKLTWELKDRFNQRLATGVYLYLIKGSGLEKMGKIAVVRK